MVIGLKKTKAGNWMCVTHHPESKKKQREATSKGGKASAKVQHGERLFLTLNIEPNKGSVLKALVAQANFLAKDVGPKEMKRHRMIVDINKLIFEFATEGLGEGEKDIKVKELLDSKLPPSVKLGKLVDLVGPNAALELVQVELTRDSYEHEVLDGVKLVQDAKVGEGSISTPHALHIESKDDTSDDVPDLDVGTPDQPDPKDQAEAAAIAAAASVKETPEEPKENPEDRKARAVREANELVGLYKTKIIGSIRTLAEVGKIFYDALLAGEVTFRDLQQRVMFPKSDTDQPDMMVRDVKDAAAKRKTA